MLRVAKNLFGCLSLPPNQFSSWTHAVCPWSIACNDQNLRAVGLHDGTRCRVLATSKKLNIAKVANALIESLFCFVPPVTAHPCLEFGSKEMNFTWCRSCILCGAALWTWLTLPTREFRTWPAAGKILNAAPAPIYTYSIVYELRCHVFTAVHVEITMR